MKIGGISTLFSNNNLGFKPNGFKRYLQPTENIKEIEKKLAMGMSTDDLSEEEYNTLAAFEKAESAAFHAEVNKEMSEAERIAIKLAKGEKLSAEEERFISEKYPDLKREAEEAKKQGDDLRKRIDQAKTKEEKQQIASTALNNVGTMLSKGTIAPIQANIKLAAIEKAIEDSKESDTDMTKPMDHKKIKSGVFFLDKRV